MKRATKQKFSLRITLFLGVALLFLIFGSYVFQVNSLTMLAYEAKNEETELKTLSFETASLEANHRETFAVQQLGILAQDLNFEKTGVIHYVRILESAVAQKHE